MCGGGGGSWKANNIRGLPLAGGGEGGLRQFADFPLRKRGVDTPMDTMIFMYWYSFFICKWMICVAFSNLTLFLDNNTHELLSWEQKGIEVERPREREREERESKKKKIANKREKEKMFVIFSMYSCRAKVSFSYFLVHLYLVVFKNYSGFNLHSAGFSLVSCYVM